MPVTPILGLPYPSPDDSPNGSAQIEDLATALDTAVFIVGEVRTFALANPPPKWLQCSGQLLDSATYPELSAAIGTTWNLGGEAAGQFRVPDCRDRALVGAGPTHALASRFGSSTVALTIAQLAAHAHAITDPGHNHTQEAGGNMLVDDTGGTSTFGYAGASGIALQHRVARDVARYTGITIQNAGSGEAHPNEPPSIAMLVCIYAGR